MDTVILVVRQLLLFAHTLAFAFAIVTVVRADWAVLATRGLDAGELHATGRRVAWLLALLWLTGTGLVFLDVGLDWAALVARPKLAAKLSVVGLLTINGLLLHWLAFPMLTTFQRHAARAATVCTVLGAVGTTSWLYASFMGVSRLVAPFMTYGTFLALYTVCLALGLGIGLAQARPCIECLLKRQPASEEAIAQAINDAFGPATVSLTGGSQRRTGSPLHGHGHRGLIQCCPRHADKQRG